MRTWSVSEFAELIGTTTSTLRAWERRYHLFNPSRLSSGYRLYDESDLQVILYVLHKKEHGQALKEIVALGRQRLKQQSVQLFLNSANISAVAVNLLCEGNINAATKLVEKLQKISPSPINFADYCLIIMHDVGECWRQGKLPVFTEHAFTARIKHMLMAVLFQPTNGVSVDRLTTPEDAENLPLCKATTQQIVCCALSGEFHELGLVRLAIYLREWGFQVIYLGANTPIFTLKECIHQLKPNGVCISTTHANKAEFTVQQLIEAAEVMGPKSIPLFVGGAGIQVFTEAAKHQISSITQTTFTESLEELKKALR